MDIAVYTQERKTEKPGHPKSSLFGLLHSMRTFQGEEPVATGLSRLFGCYADRAQKHDAADEHHERREERAPVQVESVRERADDRGRDSVAKSMNEEDIHCHRGGPDPGRQAPKD